MLHIYLSAHRQGGNDLAPPGLVTTVSPTPLDAQTLGTVTSMSGGGSPLPIIATKSSALSFDMPLAYDSAAAMRQIEQLYQGCDKCHLSERRNYVTFLKGNPHSAIAVIGGGPDAEEDLSGCLFTGKAGRFQDEIFKQVGIDPIQDIAWLNTQSCRPCKFRWTADRAPTLVEQLACSERLFLTLRAIRPRTVICFGKHATSMFWDEAPPFNSWYMRESGGEKIIVGTMHHPDYLRRSVMTNYREYFAAKMFLRRLRLGMSKLQKIKNWTWIPRYLSKFMTEGQPLCGGMENG